MPINIYLFAFLVSMGLNISLFVVASALKTDKFTDFTYGLTFILLALLFLFLNQTFFTFQLLLVAMISIWAVRLMTYLLIRILKIKKDTRFDKIRENKLEFFRFWFFQGLAVWAIMLPAIYMLDLAKDISLNAIMILGMGIWALGLGIETVADWQKFVFKNDPKNKDSWIASGLWKYSRHPNYFGEMLVWWGIFVFALPLLSGWAWVTILGPVFITFILLFVSGIPPLEKRYAKKYAGNKDYWEYKKKTSLLVPFLPGK